MEQAPEEYITRKAQEAFDLDEDKRILKKLRVPFTDTEFSTFGTEIIHINETQMSLSFQPLEIPECDLTLPDLVKMIESDEDLDWEQTLKAFTLFYADDVVGGKKEDMKLIDKFSLKNESAEWSMGEIDEQLKIVTSAEQLMPGNLNMFIPEKKWVILLGSSLHTPEGIIVALHEIGHSAYCLNKPDKGKAFLDASNKIKRWHTDKSQPPVTTEEAALVLEGERDAWAYAFNVLHPFMKDLNLQPNDLLTYKKGGLKTYSDMVKVSMDYSKDNKF